MDEFDYQRAVEKVLGKILNFISLQPRSAWEIDSALNKYLARLKLQADDRAKIYQKIFEELTEEKFVDDEMFAKNTVLSFTNSSKPRSTAEIKRYLLKKHISQQLISKYISTVDPEQELDRAVELARKKLRLIRVEPSSAVARQKLGNYLRQKGFSGEATWRAVDIVAGVK